MKKWIKAVSALAVATAMCFGVGATVGCSDNDDKNGDDHSQHNSWSEWKDDATQGDHYRECQAEGCDEVERGNHSYDNDQDTTCNDCGHVRTVTPPAVDGGTIDDPYTLEAGTIILDIPANGSVYYSIYTFGMAQRFTFISDSANVLLSVYNNLTPGSAIEYKSDSDGFYCEVELETMNYYYFVFSSKDGSAVKYSVSVTADVVDKGDGEEGSENNPIIITDLGKIERNDVSDEVYYRYTVTADDAKLYFAAGENTMIIVSYDYYSLWSTEASDAEKMFAGLEIEADTVITIVVSYYDESFTTFTGNVSFTISNEPIVA